MDFSELPDDTKETKIDNTADNNIETSVFTSTDGVLTDLIIPTCVSALEDKLEDDSGMSSASSSKASSPAPMPMPAPEVLLKYQMQPKRSIRIVQNISKAEYEKKFGENSLSTKAQDTKKMTHSVDPPKKKVKHEQRSPLNIDDLKLQIECPASIFPEDLKHSICKTCYSDTNPRTLMMDICDECSSQGDDLKCFICNKEGTIVRCAVENDCLHMYHPDCLKPLKLHGGTPPACPQHRCHTCLLKECQRNGVLMRCVKCPVAYHDSVFCLPAGSSIISNTQLVCPRHDDDAKKKLTKLNIEFCILCGLFGDLVCCDGCCYSFHRKCLDRDVSETEAFYCDNCNDGVLPLNFSIVWAKSKAFRFWPALVLPDNLVPFTTLKKKTFDSQFCVEYLGTGDFDWTSFERVYLFEETLQETYYKLNTKTSNLLKKSFENGVAEGIDLIKVLAELRIKDLHFEPEPYIKITENFLIPPVQYVREDALADDCNCTESNPCGSYNNQCLNLVTFFECNASCKLGDKCQNQRIRNKKNAQTKIIMTPNSGFGLITTKDLKEGAFIAEYVGDLINTDEKNRRMTAMNEAGTTKYYFMELSQHVYIDAGPRGNESRFINHSCDPNCESIPMFVDGYKRIGIFTTRDIKADTELTFDYDMKTFHVKCHCGSKNCRGTIGKEESEKPPK